MRIAFVSSLYSGWGGSEELWVRAATHALTQNHEVLISIYDTGLLPSPITELEKKGAILSKRPNEKYLSGTLSGKVKNNLNKLFSVDTYNPVKKFNPQIILINQGGTYDFTWQNDLAKFILTSSRPCIFILNHYNEEHAILSLNDILLSRDIFRKTKRVFFISEKNRDRAVRQLAFRIENSEIILNPIKTKTKLIPFPSSTTINFALVGRLDAQFKGQDLLFEVLAQDKWKERNWHLNLYGEGKDKEYLLELCAFLNLQNKISFKGHVSDIENVWENNHALILSSFNEGTPLALLEAMACGRSAIVTNVGDNENYIKNEITGFLADAPTPDLLDKALEEFWENRDKIELLGKRCFDTINDKYKEDPGKSLLTKMFLYYQSSSE
jgi:L-malate glycosyltransferase